ncbi:MAG: hypothetical protein LBP87_14240 [Planctomycetaceae bacterium]|nr:hypothetical protein [Planctomycetaceae bacterium]
MFIPPLNAQESGKNSSPSQEKNVEPETCSASAELDKKLDKKQFYLLRTGFLTEGTATNDGKQYLLKTNFGTMSVPVANVEFVGETREDVYRYKKGFTNNRDCKELIKLAEWCFNNKLTQQGIAEYQLALQAAPNTILADVIRKRLETLQNSTSEPTGLSGVQTVFSQSSEESDNTEFNRWKNGIPKPVVDSFAKIVQPVLVSRCAATDCHGSGSENQFKLSIPSHTHGNTTYRNLQSVLQWIDLDYPVESQLLSVLISYHGGTKAAFSVESTQYNNIVQWVRLTAKELPNEYRTQPDNQKIIDQKITDQKNTDQKNNFQSAQNESVLRQKENVLPPALRDAILREPATTSPLPENPDSVQIKTNRTIPNNYSPTRLNIPNAPLQKSPAINDLPPTTDSAKDPFDPHFFNLRYHGK